MSLHVKLNISLGQCDCVIKRMTYENRETFEADLWRGSEFLDSRITVFRACVYLKWDGQQYKKETYGIYE